jgi:hypothetical protein
MFLRSAVQYVLARPRGGNLVKTQVVSFFFLCFSTFLPFSPSPLPLPPSHGAAVVSSAKHSS